MKYKFIVIFVFTSIVSFGQMTVNDIMRIYKMDADQFETYALNNKFEFNRISDIKENHGYIYRKGFSPKSTKYLKLYDSFYDIGINVSYQTSEVAEYLDFKSQLRNLGFKLEETKSFTDDKDNTTSQVNIYKLNNSIFRIYIIPEHYFNNQFQPVTYEINYFKN